MNRDGTGPSGPSGPTPPQPDPGPSGPGRVWIDRVDHYRIDARFGDLLVAYAVRTAWGWSVVRRQAGKRFVSRHVDNARDAATLLTFYASRYIPRDRVSGRLRIA
jgi:hypothetical protein